MDSDDVLGDGGRKALDACVKVKIVCKPEIQEYDRNSALERILSCYAGSIPKGLYQWSVFDPLTLFDIRGGHNVSKMKRSYTIKEIYNALINFDEVKYVQKYPKGPGSAEKRELIDKRREDVKKEHKEASNNPAGRQEYSLVVAQRRVKDCFAGNFAGDSPVLERKPNNEPYRIDEIYQAVVRIHKEGRLLRYDGENLLKQLIDENWNDLIKEHNEALKSGDATKREYSWSEAEHRVRHCFAGTLLDDTDIFPTTKASYDIFDINTAIEHFDTKKLIDKYPKPGSGYDEEKEEVDTRRVLMKTEYDEATTMVEVEHGSGFIIHDHSIITNEHVIKTYLDDKRKYEIHISNAVINDLPCTDAHYDSKKDLALLYCRDLNLKECGIHPLQLSSQPLSTGRKMFCFGYPVNHTGETALFVEGTVSGFKKTLFGEPLMVLNCSLCSGNSGGPVLCRTKGEIKVVGVVKQKHTKEILTPAEVTAIVEHSVDDVTKTLPTAYDSSSEVAQTLVDGLSLRLHKALMSTHSPFNFGDALPGSLIIEFMADCDKRYTKLDVRKTSSNF